MTTEITAAHPAPAPKPARTLRERLTRNPVVLKELRGRMRGARAFLLLTFHLLAMSGFVTLLYATYMASINSASSGANSQWLGKVVFGGVVGVELLLACFITPAVTAGAISGERERQTYDLLRTTLLSAQALVLGKLASALLFVLLLLLVALPLQSLAFLLGGVAPEEVLIASVLLIATAFLFGSAGIFFSSLMRRTLGATVLTYSFALLDTLGLPLLMLAVLPLAGLFFYSAPPGPFLEATLIYVFGLLISLNPIATAITTEALLVNQYQTALYFTFPLSSGVSIPLVSPWLPCVIFCFGLGGLMVLMSIQMVKSAER
ncbi:MAG: ABC transporter permease [Anaerolineales bacterium]